MLESGYPQSWEETKMYALYTVESYGTHKSWGSTALILLIYDFCAAHVTHNKVISNNRPLTDAEAHYIKQRQLLYYRDEFGDRGEKVTVDPSLVFENPRLGYTYIALQALK
ncbi:putative leucine-rich repeat extensin-like protein 4 [Forsythia ovata]|uniref:Leucine-rich repeat extensin-like protein 4 n=1 Tax=Forsythia ovata TaxID=205694 RepID=A0ABD1S0N6_9LAMI